MEPKMKPKTIQVKKRKQEENLLSRITLNSKVLVGKPTIRGMRISVEHILNLLGQGMSHQEVRREFPVLKEEDIRAALLYARETMAQEKVYKIRVA